MATDYRIAATMKHALCLQSTAAASGEASAWARGLAEGAGLPEERIYAIDLCIVEMVSNVVDHGYRGARGEIDIELELRGGDALVTISDAAPAFDPLSIPAPAVPASLDDASIGGYGIHMVRSAADECRYERRGGRNVFTARFG